MIFNTNRWHCILHVDETAIGGKRKYHRGAYRKGPRWLFGIVDKINHKILLQFVQYKDKLTILPIIYQNVQRETQINSDGAKVYKGLMMRQPDAGSVLIV